MQLLKACTLSLALIPALSSAETSNTTPTNCKQFAAKQLKEIKQDYYGALSRDEIALTLEVAERSCLALYSSVEEERTALQAQPYQVKKEKIHWWDEHAEEGRAIPNIKKAQKTGGK